MSRRQLPKQAAPRVLVKTGKPGPFQQLANDLAAHRRQKPIIVLPAPRPQLNQAKQINTLRQEIGKFKR